MDFDEFVKFAKKYESAPDSEKPIAWLAIATGAAMNMHSIRYCLVAIAIAEAVQSFALFFQSASK